MNVGHGARCPGGQQMVDRLVSERQRLAVQSYVLDWNRGGGDSRPCQLPPDSRGIDGPHSPYRGWVIRDVAAGTETDFKHLTIELTSDPCAQPGELSSAERNVDEARKYLVFVEPHSHSLPPNEIRRAGAAGWLRTGERL